ALLVRDCNDDVQARELRGMLANLGDFDCDFRKFWLVQTHLDELDSIVRDQCWSTHICFIHDSLRHSKKALLYDVPVAYLESKFGNARSHEAEKSGVRSQESESASTFLGGSNDLPT